MKRKFLYVFALSAGLFSLASCQGTPGIQGEQGIQGEKGDKGETGATGAQGEKGETGENGKDGVDGKDGTSLLTGDGAPKSELGNDGDTYIDLKTYDLYKKVEGNWVKQGNIKGSNGTSGQNYYSSTILPSTYGYVVPSKGSARNGESIVYTVYVEDDENVSKALQLFVDGKAVKLSKVNDETYIYETTMKQNGHVVQAKFYNATSFQTNLSNGGEYVLLGDVTLSGTPKATSRYSTLSKFKVLRDDTPSINVSNSLGLDLNGKTLDLGNNSLVIENGADFTLTSSNDEESSTSGTLKGSGSSVVEIKASDESKSKVSVNSGAKISSTSNNSEASAIKVEGGEIEIKGEVSSTSGAALSVNGGDVKVSSDAEVKSDSGVALSVSGGNAEINGSVSSTSGSAIAISGGSADVKETAEVKSDSGVALSVSGGEIGVSGEVKSTSGTAIKVSQASDEVATKIEIKEGSDVTGGNNAIEVSGGTLDIKGGEIKSTATDSSSDGNTVKGAAIAVIQDATSKNVNVNIAGGTVESKSGSAIYQNSTDTSKQVSIDLSGGSYKTESGDSAIKTGTAGVIKNEEDIKYGISTSINADHGVITIEGNKTSAKENENVTFTVSANLGCDIKSVKVNGSVVTPDANNKYSVTMTKKGISIVVESTYLDNYTIAGYSYFNQDGTELTQTDKTLSYYDGDWSLIVDKYFKVDTKNTTDTSDDTVTMWSGWDRKVDVINPTTRTYTIKFIVKTSTISLAKNGVYPLNATDKDGNRAIKWRYMSTNADGSAQFVAQYSWEECLWNDCDMYTYTTTKPESYAYDFVSGQTTVYAMYNKSNDYSTSYIHKYLNSTNYLNSIFTSSENYPSLTNVDNSKVSTKCSDNPYVCENTNDYLYLLSYSDITNPEYGFATRVSRRCYDLTGGYYNSDGSFTSGQYGWYWLRSPIHCYEDSYGTDYLAEYPMYAYSVNYGYFDYDYSDVWEQYQVRPACTIDLK